MPTILTIFIAIKSIRWFLETCLSALNRSYYRQADKQKDVCKELGISDEDFSKTLGYTEAKFWFHHISGALSLVATLCFLALGGLGFVEQSAFSLAQTLGSSSAIVTGLLFFLILSGLSMIVSLPFDLYSTFKIEEKFGFNRQTVGGFFKDKIKGLILGVVLGGALLSLILAVMESGPNWWMWAWAVVNGFSFILLWLYPTLLAPLFNKFTPVPEGELKNGIHALADKVQFRTSGIFVMDASSRSTHGNAYFTGVMGEKRIVLFDTLIQNLTPKEIVAVLAHELGHFKLNHVRINLIRSIVMTGLMFYLLSVCLPLVDFYKAFALQGVSSYGALVVFSMWFGIVDFFLTPISAYLSQRHEFQADAFAKKNLNDHEDLSRALVKLQKSNFGMPLSHPLYSAFYYSHPPIIERLRHLALG